MKLKSKQKENKKKINQKLYYTCFGVSFAALVLGMSVTCLMAEDKEYSSAEKRNLQSFPEVSVDNIFGGSFMDEAEQYMADQFVGRDFLMSFKTTTDRAIGQKESQGVYACDEHYFMQQFKEPDMALAEKTTDAIRKFAEKYSDINMKMMLVPNAIAIYPEYLPAFAITASQYDYMDYYGEKLSGAVGMVELRSVFEKQKMLTELYYKTDHHWSSAGAALAYNQYVKEAGLSKDIYSLSVVCNDFSGSLVSKSGFLSFTTDCIEVNIPAEKQEYIVTYEDEKIKTASCYQTEYLSADDKYQLFFGGNHARITIETDADTDRKLLVFKDSYANCFIPMLVGNYSQITVVDPRYYYDNIDLLVMQNKYTDVLFLYNVNTLSEDNNLYMVLENE